MPPRQKMVHLPYFLTYPLWVVLHIIYLIRKDMKARLIITMAFFMGLTAVNAQSLGDFKPGKAGPKSLERPKFDNKNVYIADFAVHYQVYSKKSAVRELKLPLFDKAKLKQALINIRKMVACPPADFPTQIQNLSGEAGVAVVYSISIPKAPISGAARWIGGKPLIQITDRYKTNDHFWMYAFLRWNIFVSQVINEPRQLNLHFLLHVISLILFL